MPSNPNSSGYGCDPDFNIDVEGDVTRRAPAALDRDLSKEWAEPQLRQSASDSHISPVVRRWWHPVALLQTIQGHRSTIVPDKETLAIVDSLIVKPWRVEHM